MDEWAWLKAMGDAARAEEERRLYPIVMDLETLAERLTEADTWR